MSTEQEDNNPKPTFQTANELLNKKKTAKYDNAATKKRNSLFDNPFDAELSGKSKRINEGYCQHCIETKPFERCRKVTNKANLLAHYCDVCDVLMSYGSEFVSGMTTLDDFELLSLDDKELDIINQKDHSIYSRLMEFRKEFNKKE